MSFIEERNACFFVGIYRLFFHINDGQNIFKKEKIWLTDLS